MVAVCRGREAANPLAAAMQGLLGTGQPRNVLAVEMPGRAPGPRSTAPFLQLLMGLLAQGPAGGEDGGGGLAGLGQFLVQMRNQDNSGDDLEELLHRLHMEAEDAPTVPTSEAGLAAVKTELLGCLTSGEGNRMHKPQLQGLALHHAQSHV